MKNQHRFASPFFDTENGTRKRIGATDMENWPHRDRKTEKIYAEQITIIERLIWWDYESSSNTNENDSQKSLYNFIWLKFEDLCCEQPFNALRPHNTNTRNCLIGSTQFQNIVVSEKHKINELSKRFINHRLVERVIKFSWSIAILLYLWRHY